MCKLGVIHFLLRTIVGTVNSEQTVLCQELRCILGIETTFFSIIEMIFIGRIRIYEAVISPNYTKILLNSFFFLLVFFAHIHLSMLFSNQISLTLRKSTLHQFCVGEQFGSTRRLLEAAVQLLRKLSSKLLHQMWRSVQREREKLWLKIRIV